MNNTPTGSGYFFEGPKPLAAHELRSKAKIDFQLTASGVLRGNIARLTPITGLLYNINSIFNKFS
ncbi:hypothetical protein [Pseudomonas sp. StFLB209]|uniref:hypothetical protein n=1 Tax=Pseudomonas sp. StFLB209 TaxID=1028989 RepID=UPI0005EE72CA|nr:hypothetical protein [Pseudomonas sp. StFLB209]